MDVDALVGCFQTELQRRPFEYIRKKVQNERNGRSVQATGNVNIKSVYYLNFEGSATT